MTTYRVAVIPGDGIGNEVTPAAVEALNACAAAGGFGCDWVSFPWGSAYYFEHGRMMPDDALEQLRPFDAILFGAVGDPRIQDNVTLNGLLLPIRRSFDQYACVRPAVLYPGVRCPLAGRQPGDIDFVVVRENTEGEYAQVGGVLYTGTAHEVAVQSSMFTRHGTERVIRFAFELAQRRNAKRLVTSVTKSNAQGFSMAFWDRVFVDVAREYPGIRTESLLVDAACMDLVRRPETFDVVVASNLFGDILTDLSAAITGSLGLAPSANLNPDRRFPSMFEPVHGSAPDIAGKGVANPMATMLAGAMMLEFLGQAGAAKALEQAVLGVLADGKVVTRDLGGTAGTAAVTDAVVRRL
jgi:tartrate dehydrogenase/decarboxylase / D-malate dehydrogenase